MSHDGEDVEMSVPQTAARPQIVPKDRLDSWKEIAAYLGRGERTVQRWEREQGLPVHRLAHNKHSSVYAFTGELDAWRESRRAVLAEIDAMPSPADPDARRLHRHGLVFGMAAALICIGAALTWALWPSTPQGEWRVRPLTAFPGSETSPTFSPDGGRIAFVWDGPKRDNLDIYAQAVDGGAPLRLTADPAKDVSPAWSPDGRWVAFIRLSPIGAQDALYVVPAIGGPERRVASLLVLYSQTWRSSPLLAWTPDGKYIAAGAQAKEPGRTSIVLASVDTGQVRPFIDTKPDPAYLLSPAFSPDGKWFSFTRCGTFTSCNLYAAQVSPAYTLQSEPRQITYGDSYARNPVWMPDGRRQIMFASGGPSETRMVSQVAVNGTRHPVRNVHAAPDAQAIALSPRGRLLAYARESFDSDICGVSLAGSATRTAAPMRMLNSTRMDASPDFSPDGARIAFMSNRTGDSEVWIADRDGSNAAQLTKSGQKRAGHPRWSPDGTRIAYSRQGSEGIEICVIRASGGTPDCLTDGKRLDMQPNWSRDGKSIYFLSQRSGALQIWKMPAGGESVSPAIALTKKGAAGGAQESHDGRWLYYTGRESGIWRVPVAGGPEELVPGTEFCHNFAVAKEGLYLFTHREVESGTLSFLPYGGGRLVPILAVESPYGSISASPDGRTLLFGKIERSESDLMLVEDFG